MAPFLGSSSLYDLSSTSEEALGSTASAAYHAAFVQFQQAATRGALEAAAVDLLCVLQVEFDLRQFDLLCVARARHECDMRLAQLPRPHPDEWWAVVGMSAATESAEAELKTRLEAEKRSRDEDLLRAVAMQVQEGLMVEDPQVDPCWAEIVTRVFDYYE